MNLIHDLEAKVADKSSIALIKTFLLSHTFHLVLLMRLGGFFRSKVPIVGGAGGILIEYIIRILYASDISCQAKIGPGFNVMHGHDIVIGSDVIIGDRCKIFNGVTLGNKDTETSQMQQPCIGDDVVIGAGAKLLGQIKIGSGSTIGANSVVVKDVPANCVAAGIPAKIIKYKKKYHEL
jgi:serine O-acetyltransferase